MRSHLPLLLASSLGLLFAASCTLDFADFSFGAQGGGSTTATGGGSTASGGGTTGTSGSSIGGKGGSGGAPECVVASDCGTDTECASFACDGGSCSKSYSATGTSCSDGGTLCDGNGACVECLEGGDCASGVCADNACADPTCMDGVKNGDETDVDCGGACSGCDNGKPCATGGDCASSHCSDLVCCDAACDGLCEACAAAKTGQGDGTCAAVTANTDPDAECGDQGAQSCDANDTGCNGNAQSPACNLYPAATECLAPFCNAGQQTGASQCDGGGTCLAGPSKSCAPYTCGPSACRTDCKQNGNADCVPGFHCKADACVPDPPGCNTQYGTAPGYQFCNVSNQSCTFYSQVNQKSCGQICAGLGGECLSAFNNNGTCGLGQQLSCNTTGYQDVICICSRGCGGTTPCTGMQTCQVGSCQ